MRWSGRFAGYDAQSLRRDLISGLIVGIVAIPLAMSFAIASGVKPQYGIYTTIVAGILISLFGGSRFQIGGPTGAFVPILLGVVLQYGYEKLLLAGALAGIMLVLMGVFRLGLLIQFIPKPVTVGFTAGIAVIIFTGQIANFLGLSGIRSHEHTLANLKEIATHLSTLNVSSVTTAGISLAVILLMPKLAPKVPASLAGLVVATVVAAVFFSGETATIGSAYGAIPSALPTLAMPHVTLDSIVQMLPSAFVIAMLGGIESLLSAVVADEMTGKRHNSNRELIGQGIANIVTPLFGGIPATGAIARTATNIKSGAVSPLSGVVHGLLVLAVLLLFAPFASDIPLAAMAPVLMVVAWNMSERKQFMRVLRTKTSDSVILAITFLLTVLTSLTTAVEIGLAAAVIVFVKRMRDSLKVTKVLPDPATRQGKVAAHMVREDRDCPQIGIFTIEGPLFFGAGRPFERTIAEAIRAEQKIVLLRMAKVPLIDATGESQLAALEAEVRSAGGTLLLSGLLPQPKEMLQKTGLYDRIGADRFFEHTGAAIDCALRLLNPAKCFGCKHNAFRECAELSVGAAPGGAKRQPAADAAEALN
ncbi:MAG: sulfate permease [Paenibacillaceae bacterium]|nr:sulfate permease [Paenibacillaceae bacterium]